MICRFSERGNEIMSRNSVRPVILDYILAAVVAAAFRGLGWIVTVPFIALNLAVSLLRMCLMVFVAVMLCVIIPLGLLIEHHTKVDPSHHGVLELVVLVPAMIIAIGMCDLSREALAFLIGGIHRLLVRGALFVVRGLSGENSL
jgi:hypothetical protein